MGRPLLRSLMDFRALPATCWSHSNFKTGKPGSPVLRAQGLKITTKIIANDALCPNLSLNFEARTPNDYTTARLKQLVDYIAKKTAKAKVDPRTTAGFLEPTVTFEDTPHENPQKTFASVCFALDGRIPVGNYDLSLTFPADAPVELMPMVLKTDLKNSAHANAPMSIDANDPAKRGVEQNFDAGIQFSSSVKTKDDVSTRTNAGTLDLRIAPLLNVSPTPGENSTTFFFWTPILLNAKISTGDVTTDTLSSNRVVIASEVEWRYFATETTYPTYHRFLVGGRSASDRDFDRVEVKGSLEWQPVFGVLTRPLAWQEKVESNNVDPNPQREWKRILVNGVGWQLLPKLGVEAGRTVKNNRPELAIEKSESVYRLFLGGAIGLDLSRFVSLSFEDTLYLRGEVDDNQARNYLKAKAEMPLMGFTTTMAQSIFLSYERGGLPPFSTPDVDALKLGYRVQWDGWFGQVR